MWKLVVIKLMGVYRMLWLILVREELLVWMELMFKIIKIVTVIVTVTVIMW